MVYWRIGKRKHLAGPFAVRTRQDGRMYMCKFVLLLHQPNYHSLHLSLALARMLNPKQQIWLMAALHSPACQYLGARREASGKWQ